jgi:hypothetical protein
MQMREAAAAALAGIATALTVPDPLANAAHGADLEGRPMHLVKAPCVSELIDSKPSLASVLAALRHDRMVSVRKAANSAIEALARLPDPDPLGKVLAHFCWWDDSTLLTPIPICLFEFLYTVQMEKTP